MTRPPGHQLEDGTEEEEQPPGNEEDGETDQNKVCLTHGLFRVRFFFLLGESASESPSSSRDVPSSLRISPRRCRLTSRGAVSKANISSTSKTKRKTNYNLAFTFWCLSWELGFTGLTIESFFRGFCHRGKAAVTWSQVCSPRKEAGERFALPPGELGYVS